MLQWTANTQPCTASGGISGDGWAGSKPSNGSQSVLLSVLGSFTYTLTCGSGNRTASNQYTITVVPPSVSTINNDANDMLVGQIVNLEFLEGGSCVASGGGAGDGWAGQLASGGHTLSITETVAGTYTYTVTCSGAGATAGLSATSSVTLTFTSSPPMVSVSASPTSAELYTDPGAAGNDVVNLTWTSNVRPCAVSVVGPGNLPYAGGASGPGILPSMTIGESGSVAGTYTYTVTCGTAQNQAQGNASVTYFTNAPTAVLNVPNVLPLGVPAPVTWESNLYPCNATGGQSGDGWSGGSKAPGGTQTVTEPAAGPVTFDMTCGSGGQIAQAQASASVIVPQVSLTASASTLPVNGALDLTWSSNLGALGLCASTITPGGSSWGNLQATGSFQTAESVAGTYTYVINCAGVQAATQVTFTGSATTLTASASTAPVTTPVTLTWNSPQATGGCTASGGSPGDGWSGSVVGNSGSQVVTSPSATAVTYSLSCNLPGGQSPAQTQVTYTSVTATEPAAPTPQVTLSTSAPSQVVGNPVTLSWTSQNASTCMASGGSSDDGWSGSSLPLSGNMSITESSAGSFSYEITCTGAPPAANAKAEVDFTDTTVTVTGSSGKSGGGGALDPVWLTLLGLSVYRRSRRGALRDRIVEPSTAT